MTMRILVVADEPGLAGNIFDTLTQEGHTIEFAKDPEFGLRAATAVKFDAIVLSRPEFSGEFKGVRAPVLIVTDPADLVARLKALPDETFRYDDVVIDFRRAEVRRNGRSVNLAGKELQLLRYLIDNRERVIPREELMRKVWEYASDTASRTIDTHVAWLRQKLEDNTQPPRHIQTIRGKGYRFTAR